MEIKSATPFLRVSDIQRSLDFYSRALGFEVTAKLEHEGHVTWAHLQNGPVALMVGSGNATALPHSDDDEHQHSDRWPGPGQATGIDVHTATWLDVPAADEVHALLKAGGWDVLGEPATQPYGRREFLLRDPDGYHYVVGSRV